MVVEAAEKDNGGLVYGLLTTAHNLGLAFARPLSNQIFGLFTPSLSDAANFVTDAPSFRTTVFCSFVLGYGFSLLSFAALPLLPSQRAHTQARKRSWASSATTGYVSVGLLVSTFLWSTALIFLTMIPATSCLPIVGGSGC